MASRLDGVSIFDEPKIDCHVHLLDPDRFPYAPGAWYAPVANERSSAAQLLHLFDSYGVEHALLVGPNSGYDRDSTCLLDAIAGSDGRFKGVAVVDNDIGPAELERLRAAGIVGTTMQVSLLGVDEFRATAPLVRRLTDLGLFVDVQVEGDQLVEMAPVLESAPARVLIDHCARPDVLAGTGSAGFALLLDLASTGRYFVKLSGYVKFSRARYPWPDTWSYVRALIDAFTPERCLWGSDWPFLRAPERLDYGPQLRLIERLVPDPDARRAILFDTPAALFGFGDHRSATAHRPPAAE